MSRAGILTTASWFVTLLLVLTACGGGQQAQPPRLDGLTPLSGAPGTLLGATGRFPHDATLHLCDAPIDDRAFLDADGQRVMPPDAVGRTFGRLQGRVPDVGRDGACAVQLVVDGEAMGEPFETSFALLPPPNALPPRPERLRATPGDGRVTLTFDVSARDASVLNHEVSVSPGDAAWTPLDPPDAASPITLTGLTNGTRYAITIRAVNARGVSSPSDEVLVTPLAPPTSPTDLTVTPAGASLIVAFTPAEPRGAPITNYAWSVDEGETWTAFDPAVTASPVTIPGLENGRPYTLQLRAESSVGPGPASLPVTGTPLTTPAAPRDPVVFPEVNPERTTAWFDVEDDGGSAITRVEYRRSGDDGASWTPWTTVEAFDGEGEATLPALPDWNDHLIELRAVNAEGPGAASQAVTATRAMVLRGRIDPEDLGRKGKIVALPVDAKGFTVSWNGVEGIHYQIFTTATDYEVRITTPLPGGAFGLGTAWPGVDTLREVASWGTVGITTLSAAFRDATELTSVPAWLPTGVSSTDMTFYGASSFDQDLSRWDVSSVTNMDDMFRDASAFNGDVSTWDVSNVTTMKSTFHGATTFDQDVGDWDVSNVTSMNRTFSGATSFNQDLRDWDVSNVTSLHGMFQGASSFTGDVTSWETSKVTTMQGMFLGTPFNRDLSDWDVSNVIYFEGMFQHATAFNGDVSTWDLASATYMKHMFEGATSFDQDLSRWDVRRVFDMTDILSGTDMRQHLDATLLGWAAWPDALPAITVDGVHKFEPFTSALPRIWRDAEGNETTVSASTVLELTEPHGLPVAAGRFGETLRGLYARISGGTVFSEPDALYQVDVTDQFFDDHATATQLSVPVAFDDAIGSTILSESDSIVLTPLRVRRIEISIPRLPTSQAARDACVTLVSNYEWTINGSSDPAVACGVMP